MTSDDHASVFFPPAWYIVFTSTKYCAIFFIAVELRCNYMIINPITFEPYNLNLIPITNVSTGTHNYNAQTEFYMRLCETYVDNMWHSLKALKSCRYSIWAGRSEVIKQ